MASITIEYNEKTVAFAQLLEEAEGVKPIYEGDTIWLEGWDNELKIPRWVFDQTIGGGGRAWRSLVINREGEVDVTPGFIIIRDPERKRGYLLEFEDVAEKDAVMAMAKRLGYDSTRAFILDAVRKEMKVWAEQGELG